MNEQLRLNLHRFQLACEKLAKDLRRVLADLYTKETLQVVMALCLIVSVYLTGIVGIIYTVGAMIAAHELHRAPSAYEDPEE